MYNEVHLKSLLFLTEPGSVAKIFWRKKTIFASQKKIFAFAQNVFNGFEIDRLLAYQSSPSFSLAGTSITLGLSIILAVLFPFSTMPMIQA